MPFVPHTKHDEQFMLESVGVDSIEALFDEIPSELKSGVLDQTPSGISEMALMRLMNERAASDEVKLSFLGAGAYEHHIPAAVWNIVGRGEYMTAYTPYQAEASQGTLQLIYEFQSMITRLTGMDVANASVYEGASAMAEGILMSVRANKKSKSKRILCAGTLNPSYIRASRNIVTNQNISLEVLSYDQDEGRTAMESLAPYEGEDIAALVIPCPNFLVVSSRSMRLPTGRRRRVRWSLRWSIQQPLVCLSRRGNGVRLARTSLSVKANHWVFPLLQVVPTRGSCAVSRAS